MSSPRAGDQSAAPANGSEARESAMRRRSLSWERRILKKPATEKEIRIAVVGPRKVGKSALVVRYLTKRFIGEYSEKECVSRRLVVAEGCPVCVHVWDTSTSSQDYAAWADVLLLVFSLTDAKSFRDLREMARSLQELYKTIPLLVLVGNKKDLTHLRQIPNAQARNLAAKLKCPYVEASASESCLSVDRVFETAYQTLKSRQSDPQHTQSKKNGFYAKMAPVSLLSLKQHLKNLTEFRTRTHTF